MDRDQTTDDFVNLLSKGIPTLAELHRFEINNKYLPTDVLQRIHGYALRYYANIDTTDDRDLRARITGLQKYVMKSLQSNLMVEDFIRNVLEKTPEQLVENVENLEIGQAVAIPHDVFARIYNYSENDFKTHTGTKIRVFHKLLKRYWSGIHYPECSGCCGPDRSLNDVGLHKLATVGKVLCWLTDYQFPILYQDQTEKLDLKREVFIWALLHNRQELAKTMWMKLDKDFIAFGLMASIITQALSVKTGKRFAMYYFSQELRASADFYEQSSLAILTKCYKEEPDCASFLLWRNLENFGNQNLIRIAFSGKLSYFLAHDCVQSSLTKAWYKKLPDSGSWFLCVIFTLSIFFPFLLLPIIRFKKIKDPINVDITRVNFKDKTKTHFRIINVKQSWYDFYNAPVIKFYLHTISYFTFLILFGTFLMSEHQPNRMSFKELLIWFWVMTMLCDEIRQMLVIEIPDLSIASSNKLLLSSSLHNKEVRKKMVLCEAEGTLP